MWQTENGISVNKCLKYEHSVVIYVVRRFNDTSITISTKHNMIQNFVMVHTNSHPHLYFCKTSYAIYHANKKKTFKVYVL